MGGSNGPAFALDQDSTTKNLNVATNIKGSEVGADDGRRNTKGSRSSFKESNVV
jgi:hypothetical protein